MAGPRQTNFSGGEVSPLLWGRNDLPIFQKALRTCRNFIPTKQGAALSRPGTTFDHETKTAAEFVAAGIVLTLGDPGFVRLVPFNAGDSDSFCLEFGLNYIRFHRNGAVVEVAPNVPYEVVTPYYEADLRALKWAQVGEVLTVCTPEWGPFELRHLSDAPPLWTFQAAVHAPLPLDGITVAFYDPGDRAGVTTAFTIDRTTGGGPGTTAADEDHPAREWQWIVTALCRRAVDGAMFETLGDLVSETFSPALGYDASVHPLGSDLFPVFQDLPVKLYREDTAGLLPAPSNDFDVIAYNFYRGRGKLFGFIGQTTSREFVDVGDEPNYAIQPPIGTNPFGDVPEVTTSPAPFNLRPQNRPAAVTYFQQKRVFAGFTLDELVVKASKTGDFDNFDERILLHVSGESLTFSLAAKRRGSIRHLIGSDRLVVFTASCSFHGGGVLGNPWDYDSVDFRPIEEVGANDVQVLVVDGAVLFIRSKGRGARALLPQGQIEGYKGFDLSRFAEHLFRGPSHKVVDWTYAADPWGVVWAARDDGMLLSLTFDREQEMLAWARHDTDGKVMSVCAVPEGDEDAVYLVVRRTVQGAVRQYVERMTSRTEYGGAVVDVAGTITTPPDYICIDSAKPYVGAPAQVFTGLGHLEGKSVWVLRQGEPVLGPFVVAGGSIDVGSELPTNVDTEAGPKLLAYVGMLYVCDLEVLDIVGAEARLRKKRVTFVGYEVDNSRGVLVGQDFDSLDNQEDRDVVDGFGTAPLKTEMVMSPIRGDSDLEARCVLRQSQPLPVTVVGITRKVDAGDDT